MKATIDAKELARAVRTVAPFVARFASNLTAITMIRLDVADGTLTATAGDLEHYCRTTAGCAARTDDEAGGVLAPAAFLARAVAVLDGEVALETVDDELVLTAGGRRIAMRTAPLDGWPRIEWPEGEGVVLGDVWTSMLSVLHAASDDGARPMLTGLHLGNGWAEATDTYRAAWTPIPGEFEALIPSHAVRLAAKNLDGDVTAWTDDRQFVVTDGTTTIMTRQIAEAFPPDLRRVVPTGTPFEVTVASEALIDALAVVSVVPQQGERIDPVWLSRDSDTLHLRVTGPDVGVVEADVDAVFDGDWPERIGFQTALLADMVKAAAIDSVTIVGVSALKPVTISGSSIEQLLMTVKP